MLNTERYICPDCGRSYGAQETLNRHRKNHLRASDHQCDVCPATFKRKDLLDRHRQIHARESTGDSRPRGRQACTRCASMKLRCDGLTPCARCRRGGHECVFKESSGKALVAPIPSTENVTLPRIEDVHHQHAQINNGSSLISVLDGLNPLERAVLSLSEQVCECLAAGQNSYDGSISQQTSQDLYYSGQIARLADVLETCQKNLELSKDHATTIEEKRDHLNRTLLCNTYNIQLHVDMVKVTRIAQACALGKPCEDEDIVSAYAWINSPFTDHTIRNACAIWAAVRHALRLPALLHSLKKETPRDALFYAAIIIWLYSSTREQHNEARLDMCMDVQNAADEADFSLYHKNTPVLVRNFAFMHGFFRDEQPDTMGNQEDRDQFRILAALATSELPTQ